MPHLPFPRHAWRAALALAASLSAACDGDPKPPPTPDPPQVQLAIPEATLADKVLKVNVTVSGCDTVTSLVINDRDTQLKSFPYSGGTATLELQTADIPYRTVGLAANLSLNAEATCNDGRKNRSQPQPASFFPVARRVVDAQNNRQVVTDFFVVDGPGNNATFIGCGFAETGLPTLYRVDATGKVTDTELMPFACSPETVITEPNPTTGKRWVWTPGAGAMAVDSGFNITSRTVSDLRPIMLSVLPGGDAILVTRIYQVMRLRHAATDAQSVDTAQWMFDEVEELLTPPIVVGDSVRIAAMAPANDPYQTSVTVTDLYMDRSPTSTQAKAHYILRTLSRSDATPVGAFNADGSVLYLGFALAQEQSHVQACSPTGGECEGANQLWTSTAFPAPLARVHFHAATSRVLAQGEQRVWMLDSATGALRNKDSKSIDANGALHVLQVIPGRPPSTEVYLLTGPERLPGQTPTFPQEIIALDQPNNGEARELFRYQVPSNLSAAVDDEGRLWMRTGLDLVQGLPLSDYRRFRP